MLIWLLLVCAGCSSDPNAGANAGGDDGATSSSDAEVRSSQPAGGFASSLSEYVDSLLKDDAKAEQKMSDTQRAMLERALEHDGEVSAADYEQAWSDYKQCMVDSGYAAPVLVKYSNGIYMQATIDGGKSTDDQRSKFSDDYDRCFTDTALYVTGVYSIQVGNPELLNDGDQSVVDCLIRSDAVDRTYTKRQYQQDKERYLQQSGDTTLDFTNVSAQSCLAANGWGINNGTVTWKPFG
ncbi:hypothetical protein [Bifidobacterium biavatii]|uniref:Uncharacterized protein n=1 Tax=Bifidobacterium biavatii DSM 23969 TaxID=1437608 RepID=A0A086ZNL1_9BIFI|nr:hypothetical protein [Bifidobacterium biavatii]KFI48111.1 hypothetical protein BBIA_0246 [Bifidobacterium biavatii DSM 23969]